MQFQSSSLNTNARMYLYDTPRDTMAKDLMLQSLCSTSTWKALGIMPNTSNYLFMCSRASRSTQVSTHVFQSSSQHKSSITQVLQSFPLNTKHLIKHVLQGPHPRKKSIYIALIIGLCPIYIKQIIVFICSGVFNPL